VIFRDINPILAFNQIEYRLKKGPIIRILRLNKKNTIFIKKMCSFWSNFRF